MGVRFPSVFSTTLLNTVLGTNTETAIVTSPPFTPPLDSAQIIIAVYWQANMAAATTQMTNRIRRGSGLTGTQVNVFATDRVTASVGYSTTLIYVDTPGNVTGIQYTLTGSTVGAGGTGTINDGFILVFAL